MKKLLLLSLISVPFLPAAANPQLPAKVQVEARSSFKVDAKSRNPFWPIGWKPTAKFTGGKGSAGGADIPLTAFVVTSITIDESGHFAIINGKTMKQGQRFGLRLGTQTYDITVRRIEDGRVILSRDDQELAVPLRRK
jgi:hypothetical protein